MAPHDVSVVQAAVRAAFRGHRRVVLAVSGGLDSMVLLAAAASVGRRGQLVVATFDHGTGAWATRASATVARRARTLHLECVSGRAAERLSSEAELRDARWRFLRDVATDRNAVVATAHSADDQIETVMIRVLRDAGARGLAGLYADSEVVRPFVGLKRRELASYARTCRLVWREDPSNVSTVYLRNRVRHDLLPALRRVSPSIDDDLLAVARNAADWRRTMDVLITELMEPRVLADTSGIDVATSSLSGLSARGLSVVWPAVAARVGLTLDRRGIARLADFTISGRVGARIQLSGGSSAFRSRDAIQVRVRRDASTTLTTLSLSKLTTWGDWTFRRARANTDENTWNAWLPTDAPLTVRGWLPGDRMTPATDSTTPRKVKRFLSDAGVTGHQRTGWPVVLAGDEIVWIPGVRRGARATDQSPKSGLRFECEYVNG